MNDPKSISQALKDLGRPPNHLGQKPQPLQRVLFLPLPALDICQGYKQAGMGAIRRAGKLGPESFSDLLLVKGLVRSTVRSLAFVSSLIYRRDLASRDPVAYAYNVGGKDGIPFPVDRKTYDDVIHEMRHIIDSANMGHDEKYKALRRLATVIN